MSRLGTPPASALTALRKKPITSVLTFLSLLLLSPQSFAGDDRPNPLVIVADDLGYGDLSCYGAKDLKTPVLDNLCASGMRFDNFYANCPVFSPTGPAITFAAVRERRGHFSSIGYNS